MKISLGTYEGVTTVKPSHTKATKTSSSYDTSLFSYLKNATYFLNNQQERIAEQANISERTKGTVIDIII